MQNLSPLFSTKCAVTATLFLGTLLLYLILSLSAPQAAAMWNGETTENQNTDEEEVCEEEDDTTDFVALRYDPVTQTISVSSLLPTVQDIDAGTLAIMATLRPDLLETTKGAPITAVTLKDPQTQLADKAADFKNDHDLQTTHPLFHAALTYLSRKKAHLEPDAGAINQPTDYAQTMSHKFYVISQCFLDSSEEWLTRKLNNKDSAVFPAKGKTLADYPDDLSDLETLKARMGLSAAEAINEKVKRHLRFQWFYRTLFMSLAVNLNSLVTSEHASLELLDTQFESHDRQTVLGAMVLDEAWAFNKALLQFKPATGKIVSELTTCLAKSEIGWKVEAFIKHFPVCAVILSQAMSGSMQDELKLYSTSHQRLNKRNDSEEIKLHEQWLMEINSQYPELVSQLSGLIANRFFHDGMTTTTTDRAAIQLIYCLQHLGSTLASFHGSPLNAGDAASQAKCILFNLNQTAGHPGSTVNNAATESVLLLCEWPQLIPVVTDMYKIGEQSQRHPEAIQVLKIVPAWLQQVAAMEYKDVYKHISTHSLLLLGLLIPPVHTDEFVPPSWHATLDTYATNQFPIISDFNLPSLNATCYLVENHGETFTDITCNQQLLESLKAATENQYKPFKITTWSQ